MLKFYPHLSYPLNIYSPTGQRLHCVISTTPFSSSSKTVISVSTNTKDESFTVSYLVNKCGFALDRARSASNYMNFESPEKPDSVLLFLENHGFTETQISDIVKRFPPVLLCDTEKTLLPKIEFFKSSGFTQEQITEILSAAPSTFKRSMENQLVPTFNFLKSLVGTNENILCVAKRCYTIFGVDFEASVIPNVQLLKDVGVPESNITKFFIHRPRELDVDKEKFKDIVETVKGMGFNPLRYIFLQAIKAYTSMTKETWEKKIEAYKKCGFSEDEIIKAFKKHPCCITVSTNKIYALMDLLFNKMGFEKSLFLERPILATYSLKKRTIPRCYVYRELLAKRLIHENVSIGNMLQPTEKAFVEKYIERHENYASDLLKLYKEKLELLS